MAKEISGISRQVIKSDSKGKSKHQEWDAAGEAKRHDKQLKSMIDWANKSGGMAAVESE